jgi:ribosomal-protein-alanine N-acetyltransferase
VRSRHCGGRRSARRPGRLEQAAVKWRALLDRLEWQAQQRSLSAIWLEVRASNTRARYLYGARGFVEQGVRKGYYPAGGLRREDAVVMKLDLAQEAAHAAG